MKKTTRVSRLIIFIGILICGSIVCTGKEVERDTATILENGVYFNGKSFIPFKEMILKDGKISSILSAQSKTMGKRIPLDGKYVVPGFTDAHVHIAGCPTLPYVIADPKLNANSSLMCGVTTMVDLFYEEVKCKAMKRETSASPSYYSTMIMSGPILTAPGGHGTEYGVPTRTITSVAEARKITNEVIDGGADVIKLCYEADPNPYIPSITKEMMKAIVEEAHKRNKKVFAHIDRAAQAVDCAEVGVDVLAHMPADELSDDQLKKLKASGIIIIPTISVLQSAMEGHDAKYMSEPLLWSTVIPSYVDNFGHEKIQSPFPEERIHKYYPSSKFHENLSNCIKMKIPILAGTDAGNYAVFFGYSLHNEMLQYTLAGMSNADALCAATQNISLIFPGIKTGKIAPAYYADLVVLNEDPLKNIENTKNIKMVFHRGQAAKSLMTNLQKEKNAEKAEKPATFDPIVFNISNADTLPSYISTYSDKIMGGNSEITAAIQKDSKGENYIHIGGKIVKKGNLAFASLGFALSRQERAGPTDISDYSAIEFDAKGNSEQYNLLYVSALVKDYNFHAAQFTPGKDWQTIRIPVRDIKQNTNYGKQQPLDLKTIRVISFCAAGKDYPIDLDLKNIHLVK